MTNTTNLDPEDDRDLIELMSKEIERMKSALTDVDFAEIEKRVLAFDSIARQSMLETYFITEPEPEQEDDFIDPHRNRPTNGHPRRFRK